MFIRSEHQICIQTSNQPGRVLIGVGSHRPYTYVQFDISESEARDFASALLKVSDEAAQARADTERLSAIAMESMWEAS